MNQFDNLSSSLNSFLSSEKIEAPKDDESKMWEMVESSQIHLSNPINKPPAIMSLIECDKNIPIFTKGNFSLFKGQAKSRKTFGLSMIAASLGYNTKIYGKFLPDMKGLTTLFIDTEQSDYHVYRFVNSVVNVANADSQSPTFIAIALRKYETAMRLKIVEFLIYNSKNLGYVIIDGIRDLITDINSQDEAKMISDKLLKWTKERNIHISVETNGTLFNEELVKSVDFFSISPKLKNSVPTKKKLDKTGVMIPFEPEQAEKTRRNISVIQAIIDHCRQTPGKDFQLKFVVQNHHELIEIEEDFLAHLTGWNSDDVVLMPLGSTPEELIQTRMVTLEAAIERGWRFSPRLQINYFEGVAGV